MMQALTAWTSNNVTIPGTLRKHRTVAKRDRLSCQAEDSCNEHRPIMNRRDGFIVSLGLLGLLGAESAEARSDPYYEELLSKTRGLDSTDLLSKYQQTQSGKVKKGKASPIKKGDLNKNSSALKAKKTANGTKRTAASSLQGKTATSSTAVFNPAEVGLGLVGVAGVVAIGQKSSKADKTDRAPQRPQSRVPPSRKKPAPKPSQKKMAKAPVAGTVKLSPGTKKIKSKTKRIGTVQKVQTNKNEGKATSPFALPALLVGLVALVGAGSLLGSKPNIKEIDPPIAVPETVKVNEKVTEPIQSSTPEIITSEVSSSGQTVKPTQQPSIEEKAKAPKLPPTTGNSPLVIIGGSIVSLIAAAAVGGGSETTRGEIKPESSSESPSDDAAARAKEAKAWIAAWRAKQK
jgi:hypothetical protein